MLIKSSANRTQQVNELKSWPAGDHIPLMIKPTHCNSLSYVILGTGGGSGGLAHRTQTTTVLADTETEVTLMITVLVVTVLCPSRTCLYQKGATTLPPKVNIVSHASVRFPVSVRAPMCRNNKFLRAECMPMFQRDSPGQL